MVAKFLSFSSFRAPFLLSWPKNADTSASATVNTVYNGTTEEIEKWLFLHVRIVCNSTAVLYTI